MRARLMAFRDDLEALDAAIVHDLDGYALVGARHGLASVGLPAPHLAETAPKSRLELADYAGLAQWVEPGSPSQHVVIVTTGVGRVNSSGKQVGDGDRGRWRSQRRGGG